MKPSDKNCMIRYCTKKCSYSVNRDALPLRPPSLIKKVLYAQELLFKHFICTIISKLAFQILSQVIMVAVIRLTYLFILIFYFFIF
jgi:hypothetical protein